MKMIEKQTARQVEKGALEITSEAINALRTAPMRVHAAYLIGGAPFILGFIYFWLEMSGSAFAAVRCFGLSFAVAALFIWMKAWQTVFACELKAHIAGDPAPQWTPGRIGRMIVTQATIQAHGFWAVTLALLIMVPFYSVYTFFQNFTLMGDGTASGVRGIAARAWRQAVLWPRQNHVLLWLLCPWTLALGMLTAFGAMWIVQLALPDAFVADRSSGLLWFVLATNLFFNVVLLLAPFSCAVALNVAMMVAFLPYLLYGLLGIETTFTLSGAHAVLNSTFLMTVFGITYLCVDPVMKAAYVLRCFYGVSLTTGEDLLVELRRIEEKDGKEK